MIRWIYFLILVLLAVVVQTSVVPVVWFRTPLGYVGPELLAAVAVFVALHVRSRVEAALAGWTLGFAIDLTLSGPGMGLASLLYMAASVGVYQLREAVFHERASLQFILSLLFCLFVYELWTLWGLLSGHLSRPVAGGQAVLAAGLAVYTAVLTPLVCRVLKPFQKLLIATPPGRGRR
ncbi:MAG: hypothetical protein B1H04_03810 [Planctomycetales bacterium 4484_123]|nr:MAG: hypothetical protein B1H04_03810 [Planctomycetales bacterium 4484_123]